MVSYQIIRPVKMQVPVSLPAFAWGPQRNKISHGVWFLKKKINKDQHIHISGALFSKHCTGWLVQGYVCSIISKWALYHIQLTQTTNWSTEDIFFEKYWVIKWETSDSKYKVKLNGLLKAAAVEAWLVYFFDSHGSGEYCQKAKVLPSQTTETIPKLRGIQIKLTRSASLNSSTAQVPSEPTLLHQHLASIIGHCLVRQKDKPGNWWSCCGWTR